MSTFESMLKHYDLRDPRLLYMGKIIHDIEINIWERKVMRETFEVQNTVDTIIMDSKKSSDVIEKSSDFFDLLYERVPIQRR